MRAKILWGILVLAPGFAQTPCDRVRVKSPTARDVQACLREMLDTPPEHPVFAVGYDYNYPFYLDSSFGGRFNYGDLTARAADAEANPDRVAEAIRDIRKALGNSPTHRVLLWSNPGRGAVRASLEQLKDHYPGIYKKLAPLADPNDDVKIYRFKIYEAYAEYLTCRNCDPCTRPLTMALKPDISGHVPASGMGAWLSWRPARIMMDHSACMDQVRKKQKPEAFDQSLARLLHKKDDLGAFRAKLYEAVAERNICGASCTDPCKRFLLMEPSPHEGSLPRTVRDDPDSYLGWGTWRPAKIDADRRACSVALKAHHRDVWHQLNLFQQGVNDLPGDRIRSLAADVNQYNEAVSWAEAKPWIDSPYAGSLIGWGVIVTAIVTVVVYRKTKREPLPAFNSEPIATPSPEVDIVLGIHDAVQNVIQALGYDPGRSGDRPWVRIRSSGGSVQLEEPVFRSAGRIPHAVGHKHLEILSPIDGAIKSDRNTAGTDTVFSIRVNSTGLKNVSCAALAQKALGPLLNIVLDRRQNIRRKARALRVLAIAPLALFVFVAGDFLFSARVGVRFDAAVFYTLAAVLSGLSVLLFVAAWGVAARLKPLALEAALLTTTVQARPVDHKAEFDTDVQEDRQARRALEILQLPLSGWTVSQIAFRRKHLEALSGVIPGLPHRDEIAHTVEALLSLAGRHPHIIPDARRNALVLAAKR